MPARLLDPLAYRRESRPASLALVDATTDERWTYQALDREVDALAGRLASLGVERGDRVAGLVSRRSDVVRLVHAVTRLGAVYAPLNDGLPSDDLWGQCARLNPAVLVCEADTERDGFDAVDEVPVASIDRPRLRSVRDVGSLPASEVEPHRWDVDEPAWILFTSGTTGEPRAVVLTLGNVLASATSSAFRLGVLPHDRWLSPLPTYHMGGLSPILRSAVYGTAVVVHRFDADATAGAMARYEVTGLSIVPTALRRLLDVDAPLSGLRFVLVGGAPTPPGLVERCLERDVPIHMTYGMTETASQVATAPPTEVATDPATVGRPLAFTDVTVVSSDGEPRSVGEVGELVVSGPTVTPGYFGDPDATKRAFGPFGYHTGDLARVTEDGSIRILGRLDDAITTGGETVQPVRVVEMVRGHPDVRDVAVVGLDDPKWGQRVGALIVPAAGRSPSRGDVASFCEGRLADFERPKTIGFIDELPRTASGTIDREAVRNLLESRSGECAGG